MALDTSKLRLNWKSRWRPRTAYSKNDVVQWHGKSYRCIRDCPVDFVIYSEGTVNTGNYAFEHPETVQRSYRPDNRSYWALHMRGAPDCALWDYHRQYEPGEFCKANGKFYQCIKQTRFRNTWVEETEYWTKVFESRRGRDGRHEVITFAGFAPLGWRYNMGIDARSFQHQWYHDCMALCSDGTVMHIGGDDNGSKAGTGDSQTGGHVYGKHRYTGFTFTDWLMSSDCSSFNPNTLSDDKGLPTPDGECPRTMQVVNGHDTAYFVMNNGEVYSAGYNGHGQMGSWHTTSRAWTERVTANDTTDWLGNPIKTFNQTKIVKVTNTGSHTDSGSTSTGAIGEDGSVWMWGYNNEGQLGFGNPHVQNSGNWSGTTSIGPDGQDFTMGTREVSGNQSGSSTWPWGWYSSHFNRPFRIPQSMFDGKMIVDIWSGGAAEGRFYAMDEEGFLWAWGHNYNGELGLGHRNGTYHTYNPRRVGIDWNDYGGIKQFAVMDGNTWGSTWILTNDGWLWACGNEDQSYWPGWAPIGYTSGHQFGTFKRLNFRPNGDVDEFWIGGDNEDDWIAMRQKSTGACWEMNGGYADGGRGHSVHNNNYWYGGTGIQNQFTMIKGPQHIKWVSGFNMDRGDGSYQYSDPLYLDYNGSVYSGGRNEDGYASRWYQHGGNGDSWNSHNWPATHDAGFEGLNFENKRKSFWPSGTRLVNLMAFGSGHYPNMAYLDDRGKVMWAGYDRTNRSCYHYSWFQWQRNDNHRDVYCMHSGPTD